MTREEKIKLLKGIHEGTVQLKSLRLKKLTCRIHASPKPPSYFIDGLLVDRNKHDEEFDRQTKANEKAQLQLTIVKMGYMDEDDEDNPEKDVFWP